MSTNSSKNEQIYTDYVGKVTRYVRGKISNPHDSEDVVSEVFLKVYDKLDSFDETKASLATWIYHITQNTVIDYYRKHRVYSEVPEDLADDTSVEDESINNEQLELLASALESLDERSRNLIILHYYRKMKLTEIAEKMNISYVYAKVLHRKALDGLKEYFV